MNLLAMALRNCMRQKRRTLIAVSALVAGLAGLSVFESYVQGLMDGFRKSTINDGRGHVQLAASPDAFGEGAFSPQGKELGQAESLMAELRTDPRVDRIVPLMGFTALAASEQGTSSLLVHGWPTKGAFSHESVLEGSGLDQGSGPRIVLDRTMARILKVRPGDILTVMALGSGAELSAMDFRVQGIVDAVSKSYAWVDLESGLMVTGLKAPVRLAVFLKAESDLAGFVDSLSAMAASPLDSPFKGLNLKTWQDLSPFYLQVNTMFASFLLVIRAILLMVTVFILANTMNRIIHERSRELGTLRCLGTRRHGLVLLLAAEGTFISLAGAGLGLAVGFVLSLVLNAAGGIPFVEGDGSRHAIVLVHRLDLVLANLVPVALSGGLACIMPALRAARTVPAVALRSF